MLFILVAGMPGSGKSIVVEAARKLGLPVYTMGDVIREEVARRYGVVTPELMVSTSSELRRKHGENIVAVRTIEKIGRENSVVVVDGVRSLIEVEEFKKHGDVVIVAVHASPRTRFRRLLERKRPGDPSSYEEFLKRDMTELGFGLGSVIALADYMIVNESSTREAEEEAFKILVNLVGRSGQSRG
ncbi:AAA family ATPase [Desulfurococcus mucosus]|uniref:UPF0200 protein Desmu_0585 n=1 Tax=Desulfurococcus mucosus (strain ATCC 35584 / DSM 2162 / JCM 9187 / O7/1) TaxID=765177 RepID=E8R8R8_DESM0|nr:AAA family ATPase [Desulfurococcus mucosus]ADV64894.1 dephospho-CoA kinase, CoaE [Desulfurococcus mucosus DSM 2162]